MINTKVKKVQVTTINSIVCSVCKRSFDPSNEADQLELQEFMTLPIRGGYNSVFGDGANLRADICQHCLKKLLGPYLEDDTEQLDLSKAFTSGKYFILGKA